MKKKSSSTKDPVEDRKITDFYDIHERIGRGSFADVYRGTNQQTGEVVAVKVVQRKGLNTVKRIERINTEIKILMQVEHPNVISMRDVFEDSDNIYIVMEFAPGGELFQHWYQYGPYTEQVASVVVHHILRALKYLHESKIVHRDLKPENVLMSDSENFRKIKITDFGLSKIFGENALMETPCGTPDYVAPEVLSGKSYTEAVDLWAVGVIMYMLLCGSPPFSYMDKKELFHKIKHAEYEFPDDLGWNKITEHAKNLIREFLTVDPKKRITVDKAMRHPWICGSASADRLEHVRDNMDRYHANRADKRFKIAAEKVIVLQKMKPSPTDGVEDATNKMEEVEIAGEEEAKLKKSSSKTEKSSSSGKKKDDKEDKKAAKEREKAEKKAAKEKAKAEKEKAKKAKK